ncbi:Uma2 family endonuclease [Leptothermofonsia sichuanensis E412]|uniref:Uma2 family endonuclease n=1 Tax=Leptothermofonsia sichuanensis TaxID=2917832 RepID=UPI001CA79253|nr:Uma2 family endonuclease [Leptothermofonsia sichuanensis]QZZ22248.1 Uma2 family endonuclease [Leptothermofonsia sichuanensis E412]
MVRFDVNQPVSEATPDEIQMPPGQLYSDEPPLETDFHRNQIDLLIRLLKFWWRDRSDFYISGNLTVYYNQQQLKQRDFRGPDIFVVLDTEKKDRRSWVVWEEGGQYPNVVIELLSASTAQVDRVAKKQLYQNIWRVPDYFWFHPETLEFAGFHLVNGKYAAIDPTPQGWLWSDQLELYLGIHERQLRWFTAEGQLVPLPEEFEQQRAEQERQRAEQERQRAERLEAYLRSQGIDPTQLPDQ